MVLESPDLQPIRAIAIRKTIIVSACAKNLHTLTNFKNIELFITFCIQRLFFAFGAIGIVHAFYKGSNHCENYDEQYYLSK